RFLVSRSPSKAAPLLARIMRPRSHPAQKGARANRCKPRKGGATLVQQGRCVASPLQFIAPLCRLKIGAPNAYFFLEGAGAGAGALRCCPAGTVVRLKTSQLEELSTEAAPLG